MALKSFEDLNFGSELEKYILNHENLLPGDKLKGKVIQVKPNGKLLIQFERFRAVAESKFPMKEGEMIEVVVVSKKPKLKLRLETKVQNLSSGIRPQFRKMELEPEYRWNQIQTAFQKLLHIGDDSLFPPELRKMLTESAKNIKFKVITSLPLHFSLLVETEQLARIRIDFFLVKVEKKLNITFYVESSEVREKIQSHLGEVEKNLHNHYKGLVLNVIISQRKIGEFEKENRNRDLENRKILDLKV